MSKKLYAELVVSIMVEEDKLPDKIEDADPYENALEALRDDIETSHWEGLTQRDGVSIHISEWS